MKKIITLLLVFTMVFSLSGFMKVEGIGNDLNKTQLLKPIEVGALKNLSLDGKKYNNAYDQAIVISDVEVVDNHIILEGSYEEKDKEKIPFRLEGSLFKSNDRENVYVGQLKDQLDNFNVVHFSIDNSLMNSELNAEQINRYFELNQQFVKGFNIYDELSRTSKNTSLINLYLMNDNRDLIFMEKSFELGINLPLIEDLEKVAPIEEMWPGKVVEATMIVINSDDKEEMIKKELSKIPNVRARERLRTEIEKKHKGGKDSEFGILTTYTTPTYYTSYSTYVTIGSGYTERNYSQIMTVAFAVKGPIVAAPTSGFQDGGEVLTLLQPSFYIQSQEYNVYDNMDQIVETRNYTDIVIGRDSAALSKNREIEIRALVKKPQSSTNLYYFDSFAQAQVTQQGIDGGSINWAGLFENGINRVPVVSTLYSLLKDFDFRDTASVSQNFVGSNQILSTVAVAATPSFYMKDPGHEFVLTTTLDSRYKLNAQETRGVRVEYRFYIYSEHQGDINFNGSGYYTRTIDFNYQVRGY